MFRYNGATFLFSFRLLNITLDDDCVLRSNRIMIQPWRCVCDCISESQCHDAFRPLLLLCLLLTSSPVVFGNPFITLPYLQSPAGRLQTRKSLRHGSTATWHRRQNKHKSSPMISPLLNTRQSHMKSSVSE